jgi:hypothetical protein
MCIGHLGTLLMQLPEKLLGYLTGNASAPRQFLSDCLLPVTINDVLLQRKRRTSAWSLCKCPQ